MRDKDDPLTFHKFHTVDISDNRRPIYGILTEPLRGNLKNKNANSDKGYDSEKETVSYIPKSHVQFLE